MFNGRNECQVTRKDVRKSPPQVPLRFQNGRPGIEIPGALCRVKYDVLSR